jgi:hypothetical protein
VYGEGILEVMGFKETGNQIWLGMKPSQICRAEMKDDG